jgi:hypothetical protein
MTLRSACLTDEAFCGKKQDFQSWDCSPQVPDNGTTLGILLYVEVFCACADVCMFKCTAYVVHVNLQQVVKW